MLRAGLDSGCFRYLAQGKFALLLGTAVAIPPGRFTTEAHSFRVQDVRVHPRRRSPHNMHYSRSVFNVSGYKGRKP